MVNLEHVKVAQAGANHSAFVSEDVLYVCGSGAKGQLGIGECDNVFNIVKVKDGVDSVACGETHTMILMRDQTVCTAGANDKY